MRLLSSSQAESISALFLLLTPDALLTISFIFFFSLVWEGEGGFSFFGKKKYTGLGLEKKKSREAVDGPARKHTGHVMWGGGG